jgi:hypothetical protein
MNRNTDKAIICQDLTLPRRGVQPFAAGTTLAAATRTILRTVPAASLEES